MPSSESEYQKKCRLTHDTIRSLGVLVVAAGLGQVMVDRRSDEIVDRAASIVDEAMQRVKAKKLIEDWIPEPVALP